MLIFRLVFRRLFHRFFFGFWSPWAWKIIKKWWKGEQNQGIALFCMTALSERFSDDFGMIFGIKNLSKIDEKHDRKTNRFLTHFFIDFWLKIGTKFDPKLTKHGLKIALAATLGSLGGLGDLLDRFFIDFYRFWPLFGDSFGRVCGLMGEFFGGSGLSWGLLGALLELLGGSWELLGWFQMFFVVF